VFDASTPEAELESLIMTAAAKLVSSAAGTSKEGVDTLISQ
jgi:hypothetical protein